MDFIERLAVGIDGVRCKLPPHEVIEARQKSVLIKPTEDVQVLVHAVQLPWRLDLREQFRALLRDDVQRAARLHFEQIFEPRIHPVTNASVAPRTRDLEWSPLIEIEQVELGAPALWLLHRNHYVPTLEEIEGCWLLPASDCLVCVSLIATDQTTGYRESSLWMMRSAEQGAALLSQSVMDDPKHDASFPTHCLSRVRAARRWFEDEGRGSLAIASPMPPPSDGETELAEADCVVTAPPRFLRLPAGTLPMSPTLAIFSRVSLGGTRAPRLLNVWRLEQRVRGEVRAFLTELARQTAFRWEQEGARDVAVDIEVVETATGPEVHAHVRFQVDTPHQEVQIWFADRDGTPFRIGIDGHGSYPTADLWQEVRDVRRSFRRLHKKRRWWPFG